MSQNVSFSGYGRAVTGNERLGGEITQGDTSNANRSMSGYTLFDMGVVFQPYHHFKAHAIVRIRNEFGVFWGEGASLSIRQLRFEGVVAKVLRYEVGDIDLKMSPFTLHVPNMFWDNAIPEIFAIRQDIQNYENFVNDHQRRMQGVSVFSVLKTDDHNHRLGIKTLAVRNPPDVIASENRLMLGATADYHWKEKTNLRMNVIHHFQLPDTLEQGDISHTIGTLEYEQELLKSKKIAVHFSGESGVSAHRVVFTDESIEKNNGHFTRNSIKIKKAKTLQAEASFSRVSPEFYSPGAQTSLFNYYQPTAVFPIYSNDYLLRKPGLFDFFTQENLYNRNIRTNLWPYFPTYNNIFPYGEATPNRQGVFLKALLRDKAMLGDLHLEVFQGAEVEAIASKRNFTMYRAAVEVDLGRLSGWNKHLRFTSDFRRQITTRAAAENEQGIDLQTTFMCIGLDLELLPNLYCLNGYLSNSYKGNEQMPLRDLFNTVYGYENIDLEGKETIYSSGLQYKFSSGSFFTLQVFLSKDTDTIANETNISIRQLYLNFTAKF